VFQKKRELYLKLY